jgi:hypothetical protein
MNKDDVVLESEAKWAIDLEWLTANNRSLTTLVKGSLCPKCRKKLKIDFGEAKTSELLKAVKNCCGRSPNFITPNLPLQESAFRVFLANGNQPLTVSELGEHLNERRGVDIYRNSPSILTRLLNNGSHYGLQQVSN